MSPLVFSPSVLSSLEALLLSVVVVNDVYLVHLFLNLERYP